MATPAVNIVFPLFPGITQLDFTGPAQFLSRLPGGRVITAAATTSPVATDCGFSILPTHCFANCPDADILCVPGGHGVSEAIGDTAMIAFLMGQAARARWVTSVCTGAFLLGAAGLLRQRRATTHWGYTHLLPMVGATHESARVVEDGHVITAGGVTSGIDFALTLIARETSEETAQLIQLALEYDPDPPFAGGHPVRSGAVMTEALNRRIYTAAAENMRAALERL